MITNQKKLKRLKSDPEFIDLKYSDLLETEEVKELKYGMDFREPIYRREFFLRFYGFHLKYSSHPGCVYYLMPALFEKLGMTLEQKLWFAFINGCTQNPCTSYVIFSVFPDPADIDLELLEVWHREYWKRLDYDTDKRYSKGHFVENVENYFKNLDGKTQVEFFNELFSSENPKENFYPVWEKINNDFFLFGRLSSFSYLEYLKIAGLNIDCPELFFEDLSGSKSHRNGICKVLGRDDLDWNRKENPEIKFHPKELVEWVDQEAENLLNEAKERFAKENFINDINYFTLESALCTFKGFFRENRRYPNVYNDILFNRIKKAENLGWKDHGISFDIFWEIRKEKLHEYLRIEDNKEDKGLCKEKQNQFRLTGKTVMMDLDYPEFKNPYNDKYYGNKA